ncbi:hypothetical protein MGMO_37c00060 [Methyloglobulus morosus KoM1]|uniref:Uncharacterized protein n=1 Tax=Methyloglobulus morosus KoM1 TaxID=1116472 RepID=V5BIE0_9GAMM|nr:hypothetical protein [Methyloglobulus morosus]ESS73045.1 hypothetical protein MGMO_37c00060 [Methyloglobulus morosus KoM1]
MDESQGEGFEFVEDATALTHPLQQLCDPIFAIGYGTSARRKS